MQRPVRGYRRGMGTSAHLAHVHHTNDENEKSNLLSLLNSSPEEMNNIIDKNDSTVKSKDSSMLTTMNIDDEIDSATRHLRSLVTNKKKTTKGSSYTNSQKADLPQLNLIIDKTNNLNGPMKTERSNPWFPKPNLVHVDSNDFIRHNHVGKSIDSFAD